ARGSSARTVPASASARTSRRSRAIRAASFPTTSNEQSRRRHSMRQVFDSFAGFDDFLVYLAVSLVLLALFVAIYIRVTPYREMALIREGNMAASFSLSGALLGFVVPLAAAVQHSVSLVAMAIGGLPPVLAQS